MIELADFNKFKMCKCNFVLLIRVVALGRLDNFIVWRLIKLAETSMHWLYIAFCDGARCHDITDVYKYFFKKS